METATPLHIKSKGRYKDMKKSIKVIGIIATMGIMLVSAYLLGTTQAETKTEIQTVTETREIIPDGYIPLVSVKSTALDS